MTSHANIHTLQQVFYSLQDGLSFAVELGLTKPAEPEASFRIGGGGFCGGEGGNSI